MFVFSSSKNMATETTSDTFLKMGTKKTFLGTKVNISIYISLFLKVIFYPEKKWFYKENIPNKQAHHNYQFMRPPMRNISPLKLLFCANCRNHGQVGVIGRQILYSIRSCTRKTACHDIIWIEKFLFTWDKLGREGSKSRECQVVFQKLCFMLK